jgi:hypothetical protein
LNKIGIIAAAAYVVASYLLRWQSSQHFDIQGTSAGGTSSTLAAASSDSHTLSGLERSWGCYSCRGSHRSLGSEGLRPSLALSLHHNFSVNLSIHA